jgi:hypothetical protein
LFTESKPGKQSWWEKAFREASIEASAESWKSDGKKTITFMFDSPRDCYTVTDGVGTTQHGHVMYHAARDF